VKQIETRIVVPATAEEVWAVLMDFPSYASWNPMVVAISGEPEVSGRLDVRIALNGGKAMTFRPTVVEREDGHRFAWLGKLGVPGIFDGLHRFAIEPNGRGSTFVHSEEFRGLLPPLLGKLLRDTHESIVAMNEALVREVERRRTGDASSSRAAAVTSR
jgi:hypothetical protein